MKTVIVSLFYNIFDFIGKALIKLFEFLIYLTKLIFTKENYEKILKMLSSQLFWFGVILYTSIRLRRTTSIDQDYGMVANFLFPKVDDTGKVFLELFIGSLLLFCWWLYSVKDKKPSLF